MAPPPLRPVAEMRIILNANATVEIHGPIEDKVLCYGLLELARDLVRDYKASVIVPPPPT